MNRCCTQCHLSQPHIVSQLLGKPSTVMSETKYILTMTQVRLFGTGELPNCCEHFSFWVFTPCEESFVLQLLEKCKWIFSWISAKVLKVYIWSQHHKNLFFIFMKIVWQSAHFQRIYKRKGKRKFIFQMGRTETKFLIFYC